MAGITISPQFLESPETANFQEDAAGSCARADAQSTSGQNLFATSNEGSVEQGDWQGKVSKDAKTGVQP